MTLPQPILTLGQAIFAALLVAGTSLAYFHVTAAGDTARELDTHGGAYP